MERQEIKSARTIEGEASLDDTVLSLIVRLAVSQAAALIIKGKDLSADGAYNAEACGYLNPTHEKPRPSFAPGVSIPNRAATVPLRLSLRDVPPSPIFDLGCGKFEKGGVADALEKICGLADLTKLGGVDDLRKKAVFAAELSKDRYSLEVGRVERLPKNDEERKDAIEVLRKLDAVAPAEPVANPTHVIWRKRPQNASTTSERVVFPEFLGEGGVFGLLTFQIPQARGTSLAEIIRDTRVGARFWEKKDQRRLAGF